MQNGSDDESKQYKHTKREKNNIHSRKTKFSICIWISIEGIEESIRFRFRAKTISFYFAFPFTLVSCVHLRQKRKRDPTKKGMQKREQVHENVRRIFGLPFVRNSLDRKPDEWNVARYPNQNRRTIFRSRFLPVLWFAMRNSFSLFLVSFTSSQLDKYRFQQFRKRSNGKGKQKEKNTKLKLLLTFLHYGFHQFCVHQFFVFLKEIKMRNKCREIV